MERNYLKSIISIILFIPLIVHLKMVDLEPYVAKYWTTGNKNFDFFSYYKSKALILFTIITLVLFIYQVKNGYIQIKKSKLYIFCSVYIISVIMSTLFSKYKSLALFGAPDRYEGLFVILSYIVLFLIAYNVFNEDKDILKIISYFLILSWIISIISVFQYFKLDIFKTSLGSKLIIPIKYWQYSDKLKFNTSGRMIYGTLYNPNYLGSFMAISFPLFLTLTILAKDKKQKYIFSAISIVNFFVLFASRSRAALLGLLFVIPILLFYLRKPISNNWKVAVSVLFALFFSIVLVNGVSNGFILKRASTLFTDIKNLVNGKHLSNEYVLKDVKSNKDILTLVFKDGEINFKIDEKLIVFDEKGENIEYKLNENDLILLDNRFKDKKFIYIDESNIIGYKQGRKPLYFIKKYGSFKILGINANLYDIEEIEKVDFNGKEKLGSGRLYTWSRTLPLIKKNILFGHGLDTFLVYFPQNDVVGKLNVHGSPIIVEDKPHNMYLQILFSTGIISLISMLLIFVIYIVQSLRIYFRCDFNTHKEIVGFSIFLSILSYLVTAFFYDSTVSVAPVFWILFGLGNAVNYILIQKGSVKN